ncbi:MAG: MBL fold metallo-hydrolase [Myxococcota bacterium]
MTGLKVRIDAAGSCLHPEHVVLRSGSLWPMRFPAIYAVLEHPTRGLTLFDTGYGTSFFEATRTFPECLYRLVTPVDFDPQQTAKARLEQRGARVEDVRRVVISHFHADHIAALRDFPKAKFVFLPEAWEMLRHRSRWSLLLRAFLPALLPDDFADRIAPLGGSLRPLPDTCAPFNHGFDLFSDGTVYAVPLPGHADGQLGLYCEAEDGPVFLVADACYTSRSFREAIVPHPIAGLIVDDRKEYRRTLGKIHALHERDPDLRIVPSHCTEALHAAGCSS